MVISDDDYVAGTTHVSSHLRRRFLMSATKMLIFIRGPLKMMKARGRAAQLQMKMQF